MDDRETPWEQSRDDRPFANGTIDDCHGCYQAAKGEQR